MPLCDNKHQGIVKVNEDLGNGLNLHTNLYWGAGYGIKTHFKRLPEWQIVYEEKQESLNILERVIFLKEYPNKAKVYLVADAYRGDRIENCLNDYFEALSGKIADKILSGTMDIGIYNNADLLIFNGHNTMMDGIRPDFEINEQSHKKDAIAMACHTKKYFNKYFMKAQAYPLIITNDFIAPEAYLIEAALDQWALLKDSESIRLAVSQKCNQIHHIGIHPANNMFKTGW